MGLLGDGQDAQVDVSLGERRERPLIFVDHIIKGKKDKKGKMEVDRDSIL